MVRGGRGHDVIIVVDLICASPYHNEHVMNLSFVMIRRRDFL